MCAEDFEGSVAGEPHQLQLMRGLCTASDVPVGGGVINPDLHAQMIENVKPAVSSIQYAVECLSASAAAAILWTLIFLQMRTSVGWLSCAASMLCPQLRRRARDNLQPSRICRKIKVPQNRGCRARRPNIRTPYG